MHIGSIKCGHCECMAGLGECCSRIAVMLYCLADWCVKSDDIDQVKIYDIDFNYSKLILLHVFRDLHVQMFYKRGYSHQKKKYPNVKNKRYYFQK